jgi:hypothetical protein
VVAIVTVRIPTRAGRQDDVLVQVALDLGEQRRRLMFIVQRGKRLGVVVAGLERQPA